MLRIILTPVLFCLVSAAIYPLSPPVLPESRLVRVAVLPFENRTPNPNIDWISALFVDSYRTALQKRYRFDSPEDLAVSKSLELLQDYRASGKARFQIFAAMTGADIVIGGYFAPAIGQKLTIQSQIFFTRSNRFEELERLQTPVDSAGLFGAVERSAAESVATIARRSGGDNSSDRQLLLVSYLPRLSFYLPVETRSGQEKKVLQKLIETQLAPNGTHELAVLAGDAQPASLTERQALLVREGVAYAVVSEWVNGRLVLHLHSPLKTEAVASFTGSTGGTREKSAGHALEQLSAFMRGWKFRPRAQVSGLKGKNLQIELSGSKKLETSTDGELQFEQELPLGTDYVITLGKEPHSPAQRCFIVNATGRVTITGTNNVVVVCITQRFTIEGLVEGLSGGEVVLQVNDTERLTLKENAAFRIPETFEDFEPLRLIIHARPQEPPQQCDFIDAPMRVMGKATRLHLYCMPLTQHWLTFSVNYPIFQGNSARSDYLVPNASFPLNALSGRFGLTAGYWAKYYLRYKIMVGGEATYSYYQGKTDLYTASGLLVETGHSLSYHGVGLNAMAGYPFRLPGSSLEMTQLVVFVGLGPRYVSLRSDAPISLLNAMGFGALAGFSWHYQWTERLQVGLRYHADAFQVTSEPFIIQHHFGGQVGVQLW